MVLEKITKNANYCLETLCHDLEVLECEDDFIKIPQRKRRNKMSDHPSKKLKLAKNRIMTEISNLAENSSQKPIDSRDYIDDEAEGNVEIK